MKTSRLAVQANAGARRLGLATACGIALLMPLEASSVRLAWDPNPESDIAGYEVHYGTTSGEHPVRIEAGAETTALVTGLDEGVIYYFTVIAVNEAGDPSEPAAEISHVIPVTPEPDPDPPVDPDPDPPTDPDPPSPEPVNRPPVAMAGAVVTPKGVAVDIRLSATDPDGDALTYHVIDAPGGGWLSGTAPDLRYAPLEGFSGTDSLVYRVHDGKEFSEPATITLTVEPAEEKPVNRAPVFVSNPVRIGGAVGGKPFRGATLAGSAVDPDEGDRVTYRKTGGRSWLRVSAAGVLSGTPPRGSEGEHQFTIRAIDGSGAASEAVLTLAISPKTSVTAWKLGKLGAGAKAPKMQSDGKRITLVGAGRMAGSRDRGAFLWRKLSGDGRVVARIERFTGPDEALAGLMIRNSLAPGSKQVFIGMDGDGDCRWLRRNRPDSVLRSSVPAKAAKSSVWLKLARTGQSIIVSTSRDGVTWQRVGATTLNFRSECYFGLAVGGGADRPATVVFSDVEVRP